MKKLIGLGLVAVAMFAISSGISYYLTQQSAGDKGPNGQRDPLPPKKGESQGPPAAVRAPFSPAAEELLRLRSEVKDAQSRVQEDEKRLASRKQLLDTVLKDIRSERAALESLRRELGELVKSVEESVTRLELKAAELEKKNKKLQEEASALKKGITEVDALELDRLKQIAAMYDTMEPEKAGLSIQQMTQTGNLDTAVKILSLMSERKASRILAELTDAGIVGQLVEKMRGLKRPAALGSPK